MTDTIESATLTQQLKTASSKQVRLLFGIALATLLTLMWVLFLRSSQGIDVLTLESLRTLEFNPYLWGAALQELIVPVVLLFLFSRTALFHRVVVTNEVDDLTPSDAYKLLGVLLLLQLLLFFYAYWLIVTVEQQVVIGFIMAFVAGLLGGWRVGLVIGVAALLNLGLLDYRAWNGEPFIPAEFFEYYVLKHMPGVTAVWLGTVVGLSAQLLHKRRFQPLITLALFVTVEIGVFAFWFIGGAGEWVMELFLPNLVMSALAVLAFIIMVRTVQGEETRHDAEAAQLALAQANLTLTQTKLALTEAELRALHAQINPHFFFNSLNTIRYFIRTDPQQARELLIKLSEIFQRALSAGEFVPLRDEISHVEAYLALEKARLEDNLQVVWTNLAKDALDTAVPTLVLQPIVENAVIHGIATQPQGGTLHIVINHVGDDLLFQVDDDGAGFDVSAITAYLRGEQESPHAEPQDLPAPRQSSIGLRNVDERLRLLYGQDYGLVIESEIDQGTRVIFRVPLRKEE